MPTGGDTYREKDGGEGNEIKAVCWSIVTIPLPAPHAGDSSISSTYSPTFIISSTLDSGPPVIIEPVPAQTPSNPFIVRRLDLSGLFLISTSRWVHIMNLGAVCVGSSSRTDDLPARLSVLVQPHILILHRPLPPIPLPQLQSQSPPSLCYSISFTKK
jgi:hypothetical protein